MPGGNGSAPGSNLDEDTACRSRRYVTPLKRQDLQNTGVVRRGRGPQAHGGGDHLGTSRLRDGNGIHISTAIAGKHAPMGFRFAFIPCASLSSPMHRPAGEKPVAIMETAPLRQGCAQNAANPAIVAQPGPCLRTCERRAACLPAGDLFSASQNLIEKKLKNAFFFNFCVLKMCRGPLGRCKKAKSNPRHHQSWRARGGMTLRVCARHASPRHSLRGAAK
jgi:hypothetical protein